MTNGDQPTSNGPTAALDLEDLRKRAEIAELEAKIKQAQLDQTKAQLETDLELAKARVEQELTVTTKRGELLQTLLPKGETKPLEGKIEADEKAGYTAELIAYRVMQKLEDNLVNTLNKDGRIANKKVLIVDKLEYAQADVPLVEVTMQFDLFEKTISHSKDDNETLRQRYDQEIQPQQMIGPLVGPLLVATAIPSLISAFADVAGYFSTNRSIKGREFELKTEGLVAALAGRLRTAEAKVYLPNFHAVKESPLLTRFVELQEQALELKTSREVLSSHVVKALKEHIEHNNLQIKNLESERQKLDNTTQPDAIAQINQQLEDLKHILNAEQKLLDEANLAIQASDTIITAFDNYTKAITTQADEQSPKLVQAILRERIHDLDVDYILWLGNLSSGGDAATEDRQFRSDAMSFTGGTAIAFVLATTNGEVVAADTLTGLAALNHRMSKGENDRIQHISFQP